MSTALTVVSDSSNLPATLGPDLAAAIDLAKAGTWPERVVRLLTPSAPGSSIDLAARVFAEQLAERWGRPIVIDNRPGADGIIAVQSFLQAADGHTLLFTFPGVVTVVPLLHEQVPFDPVRDLVPISSVAVDFLAKPFSRDDLLKKVREVLDK